MLLPLLASALLLQDPPKPPPLPGAKEAPAAQAPEKPLVPGALPEGTGAEERTLWQQLCRAALGKDGTRVPLTGFDLLLDAEIRPADNQRNEVRALRYRYQAPDWVRATTEKGRELLHGPKGDFLIDPTTNEKQMLAVGREGAEDRRQLLEIADLSRNFIALSDPAALRIAELKLGSASPALPPEAQKLVWLELLTPDFRLPGAATPGMLRVRLGLRRDKGLPELCLVGPGEPGARPTTLIRVLDYREKQGLVVPHDLALFPLDKATGKFAVQPGLRIWLKHDSNLRPQFAPETFVP
jgi:hypothetical protein